MSQDTHSASTTLDDIINELKLTYDASIGLLDGDSLREIPNVNTLNNLNKLLKNLSRELHEVEQVDKVVLKRIGKALEGEDPDSVSQEKEEEKVEERDDEEEEEDDEEADDDEEDYKEESNKRAASDYEDDEDSIALSKRRKIMNGHRPGQKEEKEKEINKTENEGDSKVSDGQVNSKDDPVPPVQQGSYTQSTDTRLKNPKSEFVKAQTLSAKTIEELGLFSEDNNGLETHGKEYLKKKYGVSSYPESDLQHLLPGPIPDIDFSKNKPPTNQVQFSTFQTYIESFFRPFTNEDLELLNQENIVPAGFEKLDYDPNVTPFIIPKLGPFYADIWADEDATLGSKLNSPAYQQTSPDAYKPKGSIEELSDETLYTEEVSCGPLSSRLFSAILSNNEGNFDADGEEDGGLGSDTEDRIIENGDEDDVATRLSNGEDYKLTAEVNDFHSIEERLKRELKCIGIFMNLPNSEEGLKLTHDSTKGSIIDDDDWIRNKEDDEVCAEIRMLQKQLRESSARNRINRKNLIPLVEEQIAYQEYCTILEDLDKQVDQAYMKRLKGKNKKKKPGNTPAVPTSNAQQQAVNSGLRSLLEKRRRWIENIGKLFKPPEIMKRAPENSITVKEGDVIEELEEDDGDDEILRKKD